MMKFLLKKVSYFLLVTIFVACGKQLTLYTIDQDVALGNHIIETQDHNFILTGRDKKSYYSSRGWVSEGNGVLLKLDHQGKVTWKKNYDFLKSSAIYDLIETSNQDIIILSPKREDYSGGRNINNNPIQSYYTRIDTDGEVIHQKVLPNTLIKVLEYTNGENILLTVDTHKITIHRIDINGTYTLETSIESPIHWVENAYIIDDILFINTTIKVTDNIDNTEVQRKVYRYNLDTKAKSHKTYTTTKNELPIPQKELSIEFVKDSIDTSKWELVIKNNTTETRTIIVLPALDNKQLLPKIRLSNLHVCSQIDEPKESVHQITTNQKGDLFITALLVKDIDTNKRTSISTQAYCDKKSDGFIVLKLDKYHTLQWIQEITQNAIPLDISSTAANQIVITGTQYTSKSSTITPNTEKLFFLVLNDK